MIKATLAALAAAVLLAAPAQADPGIDYGEDNAYRICAVLDDYPTFDGILGIGQAIVLEGNLSFYQAGEAIGTAIITSCPQHTGLMNRFAAAYGGGQKL